MSIINEKQIKIEYITQIRSNKSLLKTLKHKPLSHYENQLANMDNIDIYTFFLLCHLENINILYIFNRCFYSTYEIDEPYIDVSNNNIEIVQSNIIKHMNENIDENEDTDESELSDIDIEIILYTVVV